MRTGGAASAQEARKLLFSPRGGPPGTEVRIRMNGLPPKTTLAVGFGLLRSGYQLLANADTDADGNISLTIRVPSDAERNQSHYFLLFLADGQRRPLTVSDAFHVTHPNGTLRVEGRVTDDLDEVGDCIALRGDNRELYGLVGETGTMVTGARVIVEGTIAKDVDCVQGLTINVHRVETATWLQ